MIKNGKIENDLLNDKMYVLKLYENATTYEYTLQHLMQDTELNKELIDAVLLNVQNLKKLYEYYTNNLLVLALVDDDSTNVKLNTWIDDEINRIFDNYIGDK